MYMCELHLARHFNEIHQGAMDKHVRKHHHLLKGLNSAYGSICRLVFMACSKFYKCTLKFRGYSEIHLTAVLNF